MVQFSRSVMFNSTTPWTEACQASLSITSSWSLLKLMSIKSVMPSNHLILCLPLFLLPLIFPSIRVFTSGGQSIGVSASALVLPMNIQATLLKTSQFKGTNFSALSLFNCLALTSVHDYWKNHSFDYTDLCRQCLCVLIEVIWPNILKIKIFRDFLSLLFILGNLVEDQLIVYSWV